VNGAISLNAAIFSAVLLASRLPSALHVFVFVALAIQLFALFPILRDFLRVRSERAHLSLTGALFFSSLGLLMASSTLLALVYFFGVLFVTFVAPWWLLSVQHYKNEITGPWDIASVKQFAT
jgi:phosphatidylinositol glycan class C protein